MSRVRDIRAFWQVHFILNWNFNTYASKVPTSVCEQYQKVRKAQQIGPIFTEHQQCSFASLHTIDSRILSEVTMIVGGRNPLPNDSNLGLDVSVWVGITCVLISLWVWDLAYLCIWCCSAFSVSQFPNLFYWLCCQASIFEDLVRVERDVRWFISRFQMGLDQWGLVKSDWDRGTRFEPFANTPHQSHRPPVRWPRLWLWVRICMCTRWSGVDFGEFASLHTLLVRCSNHPDPQPRNVRQQAWISDKAVFIFLRAHFCQSAIQSLCPRCKFFQ